VRGTRRSAPAGHLGADLGNRIHLEHEERVSTEHPDREERRHHEVGGAKLDGFEGGGDADHLHAGGFRRRHSRRGVLDSEAHLRIGVQRRRRLEVVVGQVVFGKHHHQGWSGELRGGEGVASGDVVMVGQQHPTIAG